MNPKILKIVVLLTSNTDRVSIYYDLPCPTWEQNPGKEKMYATFECLQNAGIEYARKHFGIEPEIIKIKGN